MNQLALGLLLGGVAVVLSGCSDDDGSNVLPKDPTAQAGTGGGGAGGSAGVGGSGGGGGTGGGGSGGAPPDAGMTDQCTPVFLDAGVSSDAGADAGDAGDAGSAPGNGPVSFTTDVYPILRSLCGPCHETDFSGGHNIAAADIDEAYSFVDDTTDSVRASLLDRINGGGMPPTCSGVPGDPGCVSEAQFDLIRRWVAQCFPL